MTKHKNSPRNVKKTAIDYPESDQYASRMRCLEMTSTRHAETAETLSKLISDYGTVDSTDIWGPRGKEAPGEIRIDEAMGFLKNPDHKAELRNWWTSEVPGARTPTWDIASTCTVNGIKGLLLIETKAHIGELNSDHSGSREKPILAQIKKGFSEATDGWNDKLHKYAEEHGFRLSHNVKLSTDSHFQLSTHFAFAWKLAQMGVPVILVYLGFLNAVELEDENRLIFRNIELWKRCVFEKTNKPLPEEIWDGTFNFDGTPLTVLRRTMTVELPFISKTAVLGQWTQRG